MQTLPNPLPPCSAPGSQTVEVGIVGAGIHGAALARECTLRGVSCALLDQGAVGGGTSQWSTQLLHGGIRYLLTGDFAQMREGLQERATWLRLAPHRCRWEAFWMPHRNPLEGLAQRLGIGLYDWLGSDRPRWPADLALGAVDRARFRQDPRSRGGPFPGATAYADLLTWDQDLVRDLAASSQASLLDFHEIMDWTREGGRLASVQLRDRRDGASRQVSARHWVFALGPWTDRALGTWFQEDSRRLRLSAGIHLWLDPIPGCERPWAMLRPQGRVIFVIPRDGLLQVGTTEREVADGWVPILEADREELYLGLEATLPGIPWRSLPVRREELGVRPLLRPSGAAGATARLSRGAALERHPGFDNLHLVLGGKLTTARKLMDQLATTLLDRPCPLSRSTPLVIHP